MDLGKKGTVAYGIGAVGKDMVYALSSGYIIYYYQDVLGINAVFIGTILLIARIFDAINDPIMGIIVAKTKTKWGKFRPWILGGTIINALVLYALFAAPGNLSSKGLMVWFAVTYILWGTTYTFMDIPFWSVIPAVTKTSKEREKLSVIARSCAGIGFALITIVTMNMVGILGGGDSRAEEIKGFKLFTLIIAVIFVVASTITFLGIKEGPVNQLKTSTVKEMFRALVRNDQAIAVVITIVFVNTALYITSSLMIYFFKYDIGGGQEGWKVAYTAFAGFGGVAQILSMVVLFPLLRKVLKPMNVFRLSLWLAIVGYALMLFMTVTGLSSTVALLFIPGLLVYAGNGMLVVLTTMFLANTVDYGEYKNKVREESVIFSMQTFVVKLASGVSAMIASVGIMVIGLKGNDGDGVGVVQSSETIMGLRLMMTIIPIVILFFALIFFTKKYILTEEKLEEISESIEINRIK